MSMRDYFWLQPYQQQWSQLLRKEQKPHAVIIEGNTGIGKKNLADILSAIMLCSISNSEACGTCSNCHLSTGGHHPDVLQIAVEDGLIRVAEIRQLTQFFTSRPHCSQHKIACINGAEKMNKSAANALLKVLEEPPATATLFLLTDSPQQLLPTIRSRCLRMRIDISQQKQAVIEWLEQQKGNRAGIEKAGFLADYAPFRTLQLLQSEAVTQLEEVMADLLKVVSHKASVSEISHSWVQKDYFMLLSYLQPIIMYQLCQLSDTEEGIFGDHPLWGYLRTQEISLNTVYMLAEKLNSLIIELQTQLKKELMIESFLVFFKNTINDQRE
ncbi:DNA polymerase III subunit delta' [Marinicella sp. W31]|uniref:DNA polymerase III subunit delta' n=1 Tax=Marinicella sp. W31 TaxID=3023713 RepID=UPI003756E57F